MPQAHGVYHLLPMTLAGRLQHGEVLLNISYSLAQRGAFTVNFKETCSHRSQEVPLTLEVGLICNTYLIMEST